MAKKIKLNLSGLKNQLKKGLVKIKYLEGEIDFPISIKDDRSYKKIMALGDLKYKTKLEGDKLVATTPKKITNINAQLRDIIMQSEGYDGKDISYVKIYDENDLQLAYADRMTVLEGLSVIAHLDLEYVIDEKTGKTFLNLLNEQFKEIIETELGVDEILPNEYYKVTELLYSVGLLSQEVIYEFSIQIRALKTGNPLEEERYRYEAIMSGIQDVEAYVTLKKSEKKIKEIANSKPDEVVEIEDVEVGEEK